MTISLDLKTRIEEIKDFTKEVDSDVQSLNGLLVSFEDMMEISDLTTEIGELEKKILTTKNDINKIEVGYKVFSTTKNVNDLLEVSRPSLEHFGVNIDEFLVNLSLGEEDITTSEEGIFSAIGKGLKSIFLFLVNIVKSLINIIIKFITGIINFITGLFKGRHSSGGGGSSYKTSKTVKETAKKKVKRQFEDLKNKISSSNGIKEANELIKALLENNNRVMIECILENLGINAFYNLLANVDGDSYFDINEFIVRIYDKLGTYTNIINDLLNIETTIGSIHDRKHEDLPLIQYSFDNYKIMSELNYFIFDIGNEIVKNLTINNEDKIQTTLANLVRYTFNLNKVLKQKVNFENGRVLLDAFSNIGDTVHFTFGALSEHNLIHDKTLEELTENLSKNEALDTNLYLFKDKIVVNDILSKSNSSYVKKLNDNLKMIGETEFFAINDISKSIDDLKDLSELDLMTILYASEEGIKIDGEIMRSDVVIDLLRFATLFNKKPIIKIKDFTPPKNDLKDVFKIFNDYIKASDVKSLKILNDITVGNFGISTNVSLAGKPINWKQTTKDILHIYEKNNYIISSPITDKTKESIGIDLISLLNNEILKSVNENYHIINNTLSMKKRNLEKFNNDLNNFIKSNKIDDSENFRATFEKLYNSIKKNIEKPKSSSGGLSFTDINEIKPVIEKAINTTKNIDMDLSNEDKNKLLNKYLKLAILEDIATTSVLMQTSQFKYMVHIIQFLTLISLQYGYLSSLMNDDEFITAVAVLKGLHKFIEEKKETKELKSITEELNKIEKEILKDLQK